MDLIILALAPIFIIALYIFIRDRYEREPVWALLIALAGGAFTVIPVLYMERFLGSWVDLRFIDLSHAAGTAFLVAGFSEELWKLMAVLLLFYRSKQFNEKFDGIVYAVFVSLGFAAVENVLYVSQGGADVGWLRAVTAVPAHALFGVAMGFHLGKARFYPGSRKQQLLLALIIPVLLHGLYDFILMSGLSFLFSLFIPYVALLWLWGFRNIRYQSRRSVYRMDNFPRDPEQLNP